MTMLQDDQEAEGQRPQVSMSQQQITKCADCNRQARCSKVYATVLSKGVQGPQDCKMFTL